MQIFDSLADADAAWCDVLEAAQLRVLLNLAQSELETLTKDKRTTAGLTGILVWFFCPYRLYHIHKCKKVSIVKHTHSNP